MLSVSSEVLNFTNVMDISQRRNVRKIAFVGLTFVPPPVQHIPLNIDFILT